MTNFVLGLPCVVSPQQGVGGGGEEGEVGEEEVEEVEDSLKKGVRWGTICLCAHTRVFQLYNTAALLKPGAQ